jgi:phosphoribosylglycinamide formyltransferase 1
MKNYAFYISGNSNRLRKFLQYNLNQEILSSIKIIISDEVIPENLMGILKGLKIKTVIYEYSKLIGDNRIEKNHQLSNLIMHELDIHDIDYCISFGGHILSGDLLEKYNFKLINFHPSLLPMFKGQNAIDQAIKHGNTFLIGNTVHFIDQGVDTGKIIMQSVIPIKTFFDNGKDYELVLDLQLVMLVNLIDIINSNRLKIDNGEVEILGADYKKAIFFPLI